MAMTRLARHALAAAFCLSACGPAADDAPALRFQRTLTALDEPGMTTDEALAHYGSPDTRTRWLTYVVSDDHELTVNVDAETGITRRAITDFARGESQGTREPFDPERWADANAPTREAMLRTIIEEELFAGLPAEQVVAQLGQPSTDHETWRYDDGPGDSSADPPIRGLIFNEDGRITAVER